MVRDVAFGQYFPAKSLIHKLDPRAKIIMLIAFLVLVFCTFNYAALAVVAVCTADIVLMSGVPVKFYFKSLKIIIFIVIVTSILNLFSPVLSLSAIFVPAIQAYYRRVHHTKADCFPVLAVQTVPSSGGNF